jgi:hypothetical protein
VNLLYDLNIYPHFETVHTYHQTHDSLSKTNKRKRERERERDYTSQADIILHAAKSTITMLHKVMHDYHI